MAHASTLQSGGRVIAGPGEVNEIKVTASGNTFTYTDSAGITNQTGIFDPAGNCTQVGLTRVDCTTSGPLNPGVNVDAGDLDDRVELILPAGTVQVGAFVSGGAGNDVIDASKVAVGTLAAGTSGTSSYYAGMAGNDTVIGGPANDGIDSSDPSGSTVGVPPDQILPLLSAGDDRLIGGDGDDSLGAVAGADVVEAGAGNDSIGTVSQTPDERPVDDNAVDQISCGDGTDQTQIGAGDQVALDCEFVIQLVTCPPGGATCDPFAQVTAAGGASAAVAAAAGKKGGGGAVLGKSRKSKPLHSGQTSGVMVKIRQGKASKVLGKRSQTQATFLTDLEKKRGKRTVGHVKKKTRFKLKR